jgi:hypothetical protein
MMLDSAETVVAEQRSKPWYFSPALSIILSPSQFKNQSFCRFCLDSLGFSPCLETRLKNIEARILFLTYMFYHLSRHYGLASKKAAMLGEHSTLHLNEMISMF